MKREYQTARRILSAGLLGVVLIPLQWSCQRRPSAPVAPPPPNYFEMGERAFESGDYGQAIEAYNTYLRATPLGPNADRALFRLALAHAFPESPARDAARATELLEQLIRQYPNSLFRSPAEFFIRQQSELARQQTELSQQQGEVEMLRADLGQREARIQEINQELDRIRQVELQRLRADLTRREERIRQLTEELEKLKAELEQLKQIDLQRRPATPPR